MSWTLKDAKRDYRKNSPNCRRCKFSRAEFSKATNRTYLYCDVKETILSPKANIATGCKYYTIED